jgi:hypothetical protein
MILNDMSCKIELDHSNGKIFDMDVTFVTLHWPKQNNSESVGK